MVAIPFVTLQNHFPQRDLIPDLITVDASQEGATRQILPCAPLLSSHNAGWDSIYLEYHRQPRHETPLHTFCHHLVGIYAGPAATVKRTLELRSQTEHLAAGHTFITPASVLHQSSCETETEFLLLSIDPAFVSQMAEESPAVESAELVPHFSTADPLAYHIAMALKAELEADGQGDRLYTTTLTQALVTHLLRHYSVRKPPLREAVGGLSPSKLRDAIAYIHAHLDQPLSITMIAAVVQISPHYFCRLFKQSTGLAPHQYVIQQRVEQAKRLLSQPDSTIADIALECGFSNQAHLTKHFRKLLGVTPRAYRAIVGGGRE